MAGNQSSGRKRNSGNKGGQSTIGRGWHGDPVGHARAGSQSSGNRTTSRGRGRIK